LFEKTIKSLLSDVSDCGGDFGGADISFTEISGRLFFSLSSEIVL